MIGAMKKLIYLYMVDELFHWKKLHSTVYFTSSVNKIYVFKLQINVEYVLLFAHGLSVIIYEMCWLCIICP